MNHLHAVSIRRRAAASLAVFCLGLGVVGACSGFPGLHRPSQATRPTPVTDEYICGGVLSTQQLKETLDYEVLSYRYNNGPIKPNGGSGRIEYIYNCNTTSYANFDPFGLLELSYASSNSLGNNCISMIFPPIFQIPLKRLNSTKGRRGMVVDRGQRCIHRVALPRRHHALCATDQCGRQPRHARPTRRPTTSLHPTHRHRPAHRRRPTRSSQLPNPHLTFPRLGGAPGLHDCE